MNGWGSGIYRGGRRSQGAAGMQVDAVEGRVLQPALPGLQHVLLRPQPPRSDGQCVGRHVWQHRAEGAVVCHHCQHIGRVCPHQQLGHLLPDALTAPQHTLFMDRTCSESHACEFGTGQDASGRYVLQQNPGKITRGFGYISKKCKLSPSPLFLLVSSLLRSLSSPPFPPVPFLPSCSSSSSCSSTSS